MASLCSSPVCLAWADASFLTCSTVCSCHPPRLHGQRYKNDALLPAGISRLVHLPVVASGERVAWGGGCLSDKPLLKGVNHRDIQFCCPATCPEDICRPGFSSRQQSPVLSSWPKTSCLCSLPQNISEAIMPGKLLPLVATADGVISQSITVARASWALSSRGEDMNPQPVLDGGNKLRRLSET